MGEPQAVNKVAALGHPKKVQKNPPFLFVCERHFLSPGDSQAPPTILCNQFINDTFTQLSIPFQKSKKQLEQVYWNQDLIMVFPDLKLFCPGVNVPQKLSPYLLAE